MHMPFFETEASRDAAVESAVQSGGIASWCLQFTWWLKSGDHQLIWFGFTLTPLTVNKMVCLYFYHPGEHHDFHDFLCFYLVLFLVHFYVFLRAFFGADFPCFLSCFFWCLLVILLVVFFVLFRVLFPPYSGAFFPCIFSCLSPFLFYICFPLVVVLFFAVLFLVVFGCFFRAFFPCFFFCVFFVPFIVLFFVHFFVLSRAFFGAFFRAFFFVPWAAPKTSNHNILHFGPCFFLVLFLVVTTSEDRKYTRYGKYPIIYRVLCIPGGAGFQLSTVVPRKTEGYWTRAPRLWIPTVVAPICNPFAQKDLLHKYAMGIRTDVRVFARETRFSKDFHGNTLKLNASRVEPQTVNWRNCANTDLTVTLQHLQSWMGDRNVTYRLGQCQWCCWRMVHHGRYTIK